MAADYKHILKKLYNTLERQRLAIQLTEEHIFALENIEIQQAKTLKK